MSKNWRGAYLFHVKVDTRVLAGTAILGTLVVVFDYSLKFSGLKIPFPWLPFLKFDLTGIPVVLSLLFFGMVPSVVTSAVAVLAILARSGNVTGACMKGLAEFSTVLGMAVGLKLASRSKLEKPLAFAFGITSRCIVMFFVNMLLFSSLISFLMVVTVFNVIAGSVSILGGFLIYEAMKKRFPSNIKG